MLKIDKDEQLEVNVFEGVKRITLACGKDVLMARFEYQKGSRVPAHKHSFEQVTTILEGSQKIIIKMGDKTEEIVVRKGDSYIIPADFPHEQHSLEDSVTIDAWSLAP